MTELGTTCRNPHLSGHILTHRVLFYQLDWQVIVSGMDTQPQQELCASRATHMLRGGELYPHNPLLLSVELLGGNTCNCAG